MHSENEADKSVPCKSTIQISSANNNLFLADNKRRYTDDHFL